MERATKRLVLTWLSLALVAEVRLMAPTWPALPTLALIVFPCAVVLGVFSRRAMGVVLAFVYVFPVLFLLFAGGYVAPFAVLWMLALFGTLIPEAIRTPWRIPSPWRAAIVCWALVIIAGASIVVARETDFSLSILQLKSVSNTATGGWPAYWIGWVLHDALVALIGILWFDSLFALSGGEFIWNVAAPMAASACVMAIVSAYQLFVDVTALNATVFGAVRRAAGTMLDGNVAGTIGAMWTGGFVLFAQRTGKWRGLVALLGGTGAWIVVWASGSRTAFTAAVIIAAFTVSGLVAARRDAGSRRSMLRVLLAAAAALALVVAVANITTAVGPVQRLRNSLPQPSIESVRRFGVEMWNRDGYGFVSTEMIRQFPLFGIGVGSFPILLPDLSHLPHDNAQNWYRHQLAELGLVGSLPWLVWVIAFAWFVLKRRPAGGGLWISRGMLVAFSIISLVGMPSQDVAVTITFWTTAFWFVSLAGVPERRASIGVRSWIAIAAVVLVYSTGAGYSATTTLRVPVRAQRFGWPYSYGFYPPEDDADGTEYRWTSQHAVAVLDAPKRWLSLSVAVNHPDVDRNPVEFTVWRDDDVVLQGRLTTTEPQTTDVQVRGDEPRVRIETWTDHTFRPGGADDRELGLKVRWAFVDEPPKH